jgi:hypothetical protein
MMFVSIAQERMYMKACSKVLWAMGFAVLSGCTPDHDEQAPMLIFSQEFDFNESSHGWVPGFADYPAGPDSIQFELRYAYTDQPPESLLTKKSVMLSGNNVNRDLFMYLKRKVTGLRSNTEYIITFNIDLASNLAAGASTGAVYLKAGATNEEPKSLVESGFYTMNIDKGNHNSRGQDMVSLGDLRSSPINSGNDSGYTLVTLSNTLSNSRYLVETDANGELWLIVGTDSSVEGITTVFYTRVNVVFSAS